MPFRTSSLYGLTLGAAAYFLLTVQDAVMKALVVHYSIWQILFVRSAVVLIVILAIGRSSLVQRAWRSPRIALLLLRGLVVFGAWSCFYTAARGLSLALLVTMYYAAPLIVTLLSILILGERVRYARWLATAAGFLGVVIATGASPPEVLIPVGLVLLAACLWAYSAILIRQISNVERSDMQIFFVNAVLVVCSVIVVPQVWLAPDWFDLGIMVALGCLSALAQHLLVESFRLAPASAVAYIEYTGLIWGYLFSYLFWSDIPGLGVVIGAVIIIVSGLWNAMLERPNRKGVKADVPDPTR